MADTTFRNVINGELVDSASAILSMARWRSDGVVSPQASNAFSAAR